MRLSTKLLLLAQIPLVALTIYNFVIARDLDEERKGIIYGCGYDAGLRDALNMVNPTSRRVLEDANCVQYRHAAARHGLGPIQQGI